MHSALAGALLGVIAHLALFRQGEWHMQAPILLAIWLVAVVLTLAVGIAERSHYGNAQPLITFHLLLTVLTSTTLSTMTSIAAYRIFFHALRSFPGPPMAKVTKFWHLIWCLREPQYVIMDKLYHTYGDFVRVGPRELMIVHPDIHWRVANSKDACNKTDWYDLLEPARAIIGTRDRKIHSVRRRLWETAMDAASRKQYALRIREHANKLDEVICEATKSGQAVLINDLFAWFSFDIMGLFAFGKTFGMLDNQEYHSAVLDLRRGMGALGVLSCMPWLARVGFAFIPGLWIVRDWFRMRRFCESMMEQRIDMADEVDVASHLIKSARANGLTEEDHQWLSGDGLTLIVGGSDTTAATLTFLFYELARNPELAERLHQEVCTVSPDDAESIRRLPLFDGVLSETLRLHPVLPSALYRETPPSGMTIGDRFIPGGTKIIAPRWTTSRLESCFEQANRFIPERWFERPEMIRHRTAYSPFGFGRWSCVGKNIALDEVTFVVSTLVRKYHIRFAAGETGEAVLRDMKDHVIAAPGNLNLAFELRETQM